MRNVVGGNLMRIRTARGMDRIDVADKLGVSVKTIGNWERGDRDPSSADLIRLAKIYDVPPAELLGHIESEVDNKQTYIVPTNDTSMSPEILPGDVLTISNNAEPSDGDLVLATENTSKKSLIRRLYHYGQMIALLAVNQSIAPIHYQKDGYTIVGKVTDLNRKV